MTFLRLLLTLAVVGVGQVVAGDKLWNLAMLGVPVCAVCPIMLADVLELLWKDVWGTGDIKASDVHRQMEQMQAEIARNREERRQMRLLLKAFAKKRVV